LSESPRERAKGEIKGPRKRAFVVQIVINVSATTGEARAPPVISSLYCRTTVVAVALLLLELGSAGDTACALTVFVSVPIVVGFTTIVTVTMLPLTILPRLQSTSFFVELKLQLP